jgi:hypothetical protein
MNHVQGSTDSLVKSFQHVSSLRTVKRIVSQWTRFGTPIYDQIVQAALQSFLPNLVRQSLHQHLLQYNIEPLSKHFLNHEIKRTKLDGKEYIEIHDVRVPVCTDADVNLIPEVVFFENPQQTKVIYEILKDYTLGYHCLLIGNQGVGKNKIADYILQILRLPRQYLQLHRDSTVQQLTTIPAFENGKLVAVDSPLVKAIVKGHILVLDEADKAPAHVLSVLKGLLQHKQLILNDGRKIIDDPSIKDANVIQMHPNFRMFVLANRPGFPFLGNDFYRELGDLFSRYNFK